MKKYLKIIIICICTLFVFLSYVSEASTLIMELVFDDRVVSYEAEDVKIVIDEKVVITKEMPPIILDDRTLVPARELFEQTGATVSWNQELKKVLITLGDKQVELTINSKDAFVTEKTNTNKYTLDVPAMIINNKTMIPLRFVSEAMKYEVEWNNDTRTVNINTKQIEIKEEEKIAEGLIQKEEEIDIKNTKFEWKNETKLTQLEEEKEIKKVKTDICNITTIDSEIDEEKAVIKINSDDKITYAKIDEWDGKIVIDIENSINEVGNSTILKDNKFIAAIRTSQFTKDSTRVVLDLLDSKNYHVNLSTNRKELKITIFKNEIYKIKLTENNNISKFEICSVGKINYKAFRMTEDDRIVIDILGSTSRLGTKTAEIENSSNILRIRTSPFEENVTRFVFDTDGQKNYEVIQEDDDRIIVNIMKTEYKNFIYNNDEKYYATIKNSLKISKDDIEVKENYITNEYTVTFPKVLNGIMGTGNLLINDARIKSIEISENNSKQIVKVNASSVIAIKVTIKKYDIILEFVRPGEKYDKVLVIDPGHGDTDPGAHVGKYMEKDYNLDISLQVKDYLEKNTDIKVYMTREDDSYPSLSERAQLANTILADMYISVHNNAMDKKTWNGTEVLYNNTVTYQNNKSSVNGLNNKLLAQTIVKGLVEELGNKYKNNGTEERNGITNVKDGISLRTDLAVLKLAKMPASLIELAFMTNDSDLAKLNDSDYIEEAAIKIAEIIKEVFDDYNL